MLTAHCSQERYCCLRGCAALLQTCVGPGQHQTRSRSAQSVLRHVLQVQRQRFGVHLKRLLGLPEWMGRQAGRVKRLMEKWRLGQGNDDYQVRLATFCVPRLAGHKSLRSA